MSVVLLRRVGEGLVTLFLITLVTFFFTSKMPGSEAAVICGFSGHSCLVHETQVLYLNHGFVPRYLHWMHDLFTGTLGYSADPTEPITSLLAHSYPITLELVILSQLMAVVAAVPVAVWSAMRPNSLLDRLSTTGAFIALSLPVFIVGPLLRYVFTVKFSVFPGATAPLPSFWTHPLSNLDVLFLPSLTIAIPSLAVYQRLLRADMIATLEQDFITMARAKGLTTRRILFRHALRPSTFAVMTVGGIQVGSLITGAIVSEQVFGQVGLGYQLTEAVSKGDLPTVQIITIIVAVAYIVVNRLIDVLYAVVDPRVRRARTL